MDSKTKVAVLGGGNIGLAIVNGLINNNIFQANNIFITRKQLQYIKEYEKKGCHITDNNKKAVSNSDLIIIAVQPLQLNSLLVEIIPELDTKRHILISVVSGAGIKAIKDIVGEGINVVRTMPNTAIAIGESMTCLSASEKTDHSLDVAKKIFDAVGKTLVIDESLMVPATALCACGIAFFLRAVRAASQGGIEIGFHSEEALLMAAQTAKGAASLLVDKENHPESEVDKVTTPRGCTITGLNQMEHNGFSSAMIKGIIISAEKASKLYSAD